MSPVVDPPSQTGVTTGFTGTTLYSQLSTVFGYLNSAGYCSSGTVCKRFPILLEIGSALNTLDDQLFMNDLADYMTLYGLGKARPHTSLMASHLTSTPHAFVWQLLYSTGQTALVTCAMCNFAYKEGRVRLS